MQRKTSQERVKFVDCTFSNLNYTSVMDGTCRAPLELKNLVGGVLYRHNPVWTVVIEGKAQKDQY